MLTVTLEIREHDSDCRPNWAEIRTAGRIHHIIQPDQRNYRLYYECNVAQLDELEVKHDEAPREMHKCFAEARCA